MTTILKIQPHCDKVKQLYENHGFFHQGDSGLDLFFPDDIAFEPKKMTLVDLKISCEFTNPASSFFLVPRSSISKTPLRMANSIGLIDEMYRETLKVAIDNISDTPFLVNSGQRLFQVVLPTLKQFDIEIVEELSVSNRSGFGSTGK